MITIITETVYAHIRYLIIITIITEAFYAHIRHLIMIKIITEAFHAHIRHLIMITIYRTFEPNYLDATLLLADRSVGSLSAPAPAADSFEGYYSCTCSYS